MVRVDLRWSGFRFPASRLASPERSLSSSAQTVTVAVIFARDVDAVRDDALDETGFSVGCDGFSGRGFRVDLVDEGDDVPAFPSLGVSTGFRVLVAELFVLLVLLACEDVDLVLETLLEDDDWVVSVTATSLSLPLSLVAVGLSCSGLLLNSLSSSVVATTWRVESNGLRLRGVLPAIETVAVVLKECSSLLRTSVTSPLGCCWTVLDRLRCKY